MSLSPRRRALLALVLMAALGYVAHSVYHWTESQLHCYSTLVRDLHACSLGEAHHTLAKMLLALIVIVVLTAISWLLSKEVLRPIRALTEMVDRMGPQNLAERGAVGPVRDEATELTEAVNAMMDRLAAGYEGQRSFAANASHELRTPLAVQRTLIEVSMANARTPKQLELLTEQLLETNARNERLIEGLLVLSESDRGLASHSAQRLDEIATAVVDTHRDLAARAGVTLHLTAAERVVSGERVLLERLVSNLVRNAITYNVDGGGVWVTVGAAPTLTVENTGNDIDAAAVDGLFEPFRRGTADRTHQGGGAGLGLTIVRSICRAHHGSVSAKARSEGGLKVEVSLP